MCEIFSLFPDTYEFSRQRFRNNLKTVQSYWPQAQHKSYQLMGVEDLTIDWIYAEGLEGNEKIILLTTGEHGIEGYVGSAMLQRFIDVHLSKLNPANTSLLLVHTINPWGMKHHRRVNINNVDLNRNFIYDGIFDPDFNPDYEHVNALLNPDSVIQKLGISKAWFHFGLAANILRNGIKNFHAASLMGQYRYPKGMYYGGSVIQEETKTMIQLYRQVFRANDQILHLDMHTGYGPRYQMSIVNSVFERGTSAEFIKKFSYPLIVAANLDEFYAIRGDMIDYVYTLLQHEFSRKKLYAASFEFGTLGNDYFGKVHCPVAMVQENRLHWYGATNGNIESRVKHEFEELFNPSAKDWKEKAVADADQAFSGILKSEGYID